jgi:hypothetical protein
MKGVGRGSLICGTGRRYKLGGVKGSIDRRGQKGGIVDQKKALVKRG